MLLFMHRTSCHLPAAAFTGQSQQMWLADRPANPCLDLYNSMARGIEATAPHLD